MSDHKTEQPTPRRREKAREQGQIARSRELSSAFAVLACVFILQWRSPADIFEWSRLVASLLDRAALHSSLDINSLLFRVELSTLRWVGLPMISALLLALMVSLAQGGITWSPAALQVKAERLNPSERLKQTFSIQTVAGMLRSLIPAAAMIYIGAAIFLRESGTIGLGTSSSLGGSMRRLSALALEIGWKCSLVMLLWSAVDYIFIRYRIESGLKMSKEEVRQEHKETEGNPQVKARIRRLQRQTRRHRMLQDVAKAAVVVTNPTHFAVALAYTKEIPAPVVVAKGRDRLAQEIKDAARWAEVPIVENVPVAHALYRATMVGQTVPSKLYVAVAEILAFVYRVQGRGRAEAWS